MGQYYYAVNLDKRQYIHPHKCGDGAKLMEFATSSLGMMSCLAILLADGNGRGGGDMRSQNRLIGSWAGDRIVIAGDYADDGKFIPEKGYPGVPSFEGNLNSYAAETFDDISIKIMRVLAEDTWIRQEIQSRRWLGSVKKEEILGR